MQLTKRLPSKSNKELMVFLHNVSNNVKPSQLERAAELKKAIYAEWSVRNKDFLAGRAVEMMQADGVLSAFGYRVGDTGVSKQRARLAILALVLEAPIPPIVDPEYTREWGLPKSEARIQKLTRTLKGLINGVERRSSNSRVAYARALTQWQSDLAIVPQLAASCQ